MRRCAQSQQFVGRGQRPRLLECHQNEIDRRVAGIADFVPFIGGGVKDVLLGGDQVGSATLLRFYVLHVAVLPTAIVLVLTIHLWRWRKDAMLDQEGE